MSSRTDLVGISVYLTPEIAAKMVLKRRERGLIGNSEYVRGLILKDIKKKS